MSLIDSFMQTIAIGEENKFGQYFDLSTKKDFPFQEYSTNLSRYTLAYSWYVGDALNEVDTSKADDPAPLYPVRINPNKGLCLKHAAALLGEPTDDGRPPIITKMIPEEEGEVEKCEKINALLNRIWWENNGRSMMVENALTSQIYGGCVFGLRVRDNDPFHSVPMQIQNIPPECFLAVPESGDFFNLREAWVIRPITPEDAISYGYPVRNRADTLAKYYWIEHWDRKSYSIHINNKLAVFEDGYPAEGPNTDGIVPFLYIPHERVGTFYGINAFDHLLGIVAEMNLRVADYGDAVNNDSHSYVAIRNATGNPSVLRIAPGIEAIDLGSREGITGNEAEPDMFEVRKQSASQPMKDLIQDVLLPQFRRDAFLPAIADGEDEGSQRSALTLAMRMWPLIAHVNIERAFWTDGLSRLTKMMLIMLYNRGLCGVDESVMKMRIKHEWRPILPKDRESFMNELVNRMTSNLGAPKTLLASTGEIEDVDAEYEGIKEWLTFQKELESRFAPQPATGENQNAEGKTVPAREGQKSTSGAKKQETGSKTPEKGK